MFGIGKFEELVVLLVLLAVFAFDIAMLMQVAKNPRLGSLTKMVWGICIVVISPLAALYYFYWASLYHKRNWLPEAPKS